MLPTGVLARGRPRGDDAKIAKRWNVDEVLREFPQLAERIDNPGSALSAADDVYVLSAGRFVFQGTAPVLANETQVVDQHLGVSSVKSH